MDHYHVGIVVTDIDAASTKLKRINRKKNA